MFFKKNRKREKNEKRKKKKKEDQEMFMEEYDKCSVITSKDFFNM